MFTVFRVECYFSNLPYPSTKEEPFLEKEFLEAAALVGWFSFCCWKEGISKRTKSTVENSTSFPGEILRRKTRGCELCAVVRTQIMQIQFFSAHLQWLWWTSSIKSSPKWDIEVANICRILLTFYKYIYLLAKNIELQILI